MRVLPPELQARFDSGATTLARLWRITRRDGVVLGFTDHDRLLVLDGVDYEPESGFTASAAEAATGLSVDTTEITGALQSPRIAPADVARGLYDGAEVAVFLADWQAPEVNLLLSRGHIGEIRRGETAFEAEIVGLSDRLNQPIGRAFLHACDCRLGDVKCAVDLRLPAYRGTGEVAALTDAQQFTTIGLSGFADGWFSGGELTWVTGANAGLSAHVKVHLGAGEAAIELWLSPPLGITSGDRFEVTAGCDRTAETCAEKFSNLLNFRGFPHMPGDDWVSNYPGSGEAHDGGSLYRT